MSQQSAATTTTADVKARHLVLKDEIRILQKAGGYDIHGKRVTSPIISFPRSYVKEFNLKKGDIFMYSVVKRSPLTFTLKKLVLTEDIA